MLLRTQRRRCFAACKATSALAPLHPPTLPPLVPHAVVFVAAVWVLGGYINTMANVLAPKLVPPQVRSLAGEGGPWDRASGG
jgi:DNA-directed RNA polymerase